MAIVSANAFDKGLDNDVGITPEDFFVKPVRHSELLDWLERRLGLRWTDSAAARREPRRAARGRWRGRRADALRALRGGRAAWATSAAS